MFDKDVKIGRECIFAMTTAWTEINYGIVIDVRTVNKKIFIKFIIQMEISIMNVKLDGLGNHEKYLIYKGR